MSSRRQIASLVLTVAVAASLSACGRSSNGSAAAPGVTDTTIKIGSSYPLSGALSGSGSSSAGASAAYFKAVNAAGGVKMGDGKTRKIDFTYYDDAYDPARTVQNFNRLVNEDVFAVFQTFGTAPNLAISKPANSRKVPQLFVHAGDAVFSDYAATPWTSGWQPTYEAEGLLYGKYLAGMDKPVKLGVLRQADLFGEVYLKGIKEGIVGSQVKLVGTETYVPSDATLDAQVSQLKQTGADALFLAVAPPPLMQSALKQARTLGWKPITFLASVASSINQIIKPAGYATSDNIYSAGFVKVADDPKRASDPAVQAYVKDMARYSPKANPDDINATWGYAAAQTLVTTLRQTKVATRQGVIDALRALKTTSPLFLPGVTVDGSSAPPIKTLDLQHLQDGGWQLMPGA